MRGTGPARQRPPSSLTRGNFALPEFSLGLPAKAFNPDNRREKGPKMDQVRKFTNELKSLYAENDFPSERLIRRRDALIGFTRELNSRVDSKFTPEEVAAEIERVRKDKKGTGGLPWLGRSFSGPHFMN